MSNKDIEEDIFYKNLYMQNPISLLTVENLKELEEHCKRQVQRYETGKREKEEHLLILELLYSYQQSEIKASKYDRLVEKIKEDIEEYPEATYIKYYLLDCIELLKGKQL